MRQDYYYLLQVHPHQPKPPNQIAAHPEPQTVNCKGSTLSKIAMTNTEKKLVVIVDPMSTGVNVTSCVNDMGFDCIAVFSEMESDITHHYMDKLSELSFVDTLAYDGEPESIVAAETDKALMKLVDSLKAHSSEIIAVIPGCETGVTLAERIASALGVRSNGLRKIQERRDKYHMANAVADAGLRAVKQIQPTSWEEVETFIKDLKPSPFKIIMKPSNSAGSDGVVLCRSMEQVRERWDVLEAEQAAPRDSRSSNALGLSGSVLIQEFLAGTEYVVNSVSRDGVHKVTCIWKYVKVGLNGGDFTYLEQWLLHPANPPKEGEVQDEASQVWHALVDYTHKVLDALDIKNGASHAEVMVRVLEPKTGEADTAAAAAANLDVCLVEVGSRCNGGTGSFMPVTQPVVGYTQPEITASAYLDGKRFASIPALPSPVEKEGVLLWLICNEEGTFEGLKEGVEAKLRGLESFVDLRLDVKLGGHIMKTSSVLDASGTMCLVHEREAQVLEDLATIRRLEDEGLFIVTPVEGKEVQRAAVALEQDPSIVVG